MAKNRITWLHLSDLHFRADVRWEQDVVLASLFRDVVRRLDGEDLAPDLVFVAGDVAFSGRAEEYRQARRFFDDLASSTGVDPRTSWFVVPGNHDVDLDRLAPTTRRLLPSLEDESGVAEILERPDSLRLFTTAQQAFFAFSEDFLGGTRGWRDDGLSHVEHLDVNGARVAVLAFNGAWSARGGKDDHAQLILGEPVVRRALASADEGRADLKIALLHHPLDWFRGFDKERIEGLLRGAGGVHFLLRGHLHDSRISREGHPGARCFELASGACCKHAAFPHGVVVTTLDLEDGSGEVHLFRYSPDGRGSWKRDNFLYEQLDGGRWSFPLPAGWELPRRGRPKPASAEAAPAAAVPVEIQTLWDRDSYRAGIDLCRLLLRISVDEASAEAEPQRTEVHHVLALDVSGSMNVAEKYPILKEAVDAYLRFVASDDLVTLILFSSQSEVLVSQELVGALRERAPRIETILDAWPHRFHSTRMHGALRAALTTITEARARGFSGVERLCCLTDGRIHDAFDCQLTLREFPPLGIQVNIFGFGRDFSTAQAESLLARNADGIVRYVEAGGSALGEYFGHMARTSQRVIMTDATLSIEVSEGVTCANVFVCRPHERHLGNFEDEAAPTVNVRLGNIELRKKYLVLVELRAWEEVRALGCARFSATTPGGRVRAERRLVPPWGEYLGSLDPLLGTIADSVASLVSTDPSTNIVALEARLKLAEIEALPTAYIEALRNQLAVLKSGGSLDDLSEDDRNYTTAAVSQVTTA
jgi:hypothetical protein